MCLSDLFVMLIDMTLVSPASDTFWTRLTKQEWIEKHALKSFFFEKIILSKKLHENLKHLTFNELDYTIKPDEITIAVNKLKNGKTPGLDTITNEMIKTTFKELFSRYLRTHKINMLE